MSRDPMPQPKQTYVERKQLKSFRVLAFAIWLVIMVGCTALGLFVLYALFK